MRRILSILTFSLLWVACDPLEDIKDEIKEVVQVFDYTLVSADYETISKRSLYLDSADSVNSAYIKSKKFFDTLVSSRKYIPYLLDVKFPGMPAGSAATVWFKSLNSVPDELSRLLKEETYPLTSDDYLSIDTMVSYLGYIAPPFNPDSYIPNLLKYNYIPKSTTDTVMVSYKYSDQAVSVDFSKTIQPLFSERFSSGNIGKLSSVNKTGLQIWTYSPSGNGSMQINGYDGEKYITNEDWLITPQIDLSKVKNTYMQIKHAVEFYNSGCLFVRISKNYTGDLNTSSWSEIELNNPGKDNINTFVESELINLASFDGEKIHVALVYKSNADQSKAPAWAIGEIVLGPYGNKVVGGGAEYTVKEFYALSSNNWVKLNNTMMLKPSDYKLLGLTTNYFKGDMVSVNYLFDLASYHKPLAKTGDIYYFMYDYNNEKSTVTLIDMVTKSDTGWISTYDYIQLVSEPFKMSTSGKWAFDPSVELTMGTDDYQLISDYVKNDPVLKELDNSTYSNTESYYGSSAYYRDFDVRSGKFNPVFATWEEAVEEALTKAYLPLKFPEATAMNGGVEVFYIITFDAFDGGHNYYTMKFKVTKDAPNPEFELVEGPVKQ